MATKRFSALAPAIKQVDVRTVGGAAATGNTLIVTSALGAVYTYTFLSTDTTNTIAAASFVADFQANAPAISTEFSDVAVSSSGALVSFTSTTAGKPFTFAYSGGGTTPATFASSSTIANTGPSVFDATANWGGSIPATTDTVIFDQGNVPLLYRVDQITTLTGTLSIYSSFEADIGLGPTDTGGYPQYRARWLQTAVTVANIGSGNGRGQPRCWLYFKAANLKLNIWNTGRGADSGYEALQIKGGSTTFDVITITNGELGMAILGGDTVTCTLLEIGGNNGSPAVRGGLGCAVTNLTMLSGQLVLEVSPSGTVTILGGTATFVRGGGITTLTIDAGTCSLGGNGSAMTVGSCAVGNGAVYDLSQGDGAVTHTNPIYVDKGGTVLDPRDRLIVNTQIIPRGCVWSDITVVTGINRTWQKAA